MALRGTDIVGNALMGALGNFGKYTGDALSDQIRRNELNQLISELLNRAQAGTPKKQGTYIGELPVPAQSTPMLSQQNFGELGRMAELSPQSLAALQMTQDKFQQVSPGSMMGKVNPQGDFTPTGINPSAKSTSVARGWTTNPPPGFKKFERVPGTDRQLGLKYRINEDTGEYIRDSKGTPITDYESGGSPFNPFGPSAPANRKFTLIDKYNAYPEIKKAVSMGEAADLLVSLADSNSPISQNAIATIAARASGEVGNLSEADKAPFGGSQALAARINQFATQNVSGLRTPENVKFIKDLANLFRQSAKRKGENVARKWSGQFSKAGKDVYGDAQTIYDYLTAELPFDSDTQGSGAEDFVVGQTYQDGSGNKAIYRGNGKWEEVK